MNKIWLIAKKELRSYFDSPAAYVFMVLFLVLTGIYVVGNLFLDNIASLRLLFKVAPVVMLVFVPAVTMRLISEEKQVGTFELLGTRPIRIGEIVVGKFLASTFLVFCTIVPTVIYAVVLSLLGRLDSGPVLGGYFGLFLLGASFVAVGLFASALSNKQVVSLIVGSILVSFLFFLDRLLPFIPSRLIPPVEYLSAGHHFSSLERGVLDSRDIVYDATLIILFLLLGTVAAAREYGQSLRDWKRVLTPDQGLRLILVGIVLLLANLVSTLFFFRVDLTQEEKYTLSSVTRKQLSSLDDNVLVRVYLTADLPPPYHNYRRDIQDLLEEYHVYSGGKIQFKFVSPSDGPAAEMEATEAGVSPIYIKVVRNDKIQTSKAYAGLAFSYADRSETLPVISSVDRLEYDLTSTIEHLRAREMPVVGLLGGHGCPKPESMKTFLDALGKHYRIVSIDLSDTSRSLADLAALLVIGPRFRFAEREKLALDRYIVAGGQVAFFMDGMSLNTQQQVARRLDLGLDDMFDSYGWVINNDLVVDKQCEDVGAGRSSAKLTLNDEGPNPFYPVIARFDRSNAAVANLPPVVLPYVSSIDVRLSVARGVNASIVASSSAQSASLTGDSIDVNLVHMLEQVSFGEENIPLAATFEGSFKSAFGGTEGRRVAAASRGTSKNPQTRIAVVGGGNFVLDGYQQGYHNTTFALNIVDWLVDRTGLGVIRTREVAPPPLDEVSEETRTAVKYFAFIGPPALVILVGLLRMAMNASRRRVLKESY